MIRRQHPLFSPIALVSTLLLLIILGIALWQTGGRALSPGEVSAVSVSGRTSGGVPNHAAIGDDCTRCHEPFGGVTAARCEQCHTVVGEQRFRQVGLHGRFATDDCTACHLEHRGANYDMVASALIGFDSEHHALLFPLDGAHAEVDCAGCHLAEQYLGTSGGCESCHDESSIHSGLFGTDCQQCHTTNGWQPARLKYHAFSLDHGAAGEVPCVSCHEEALVAYTCAACHERPEMASVHAEVLMRGVALDSCAACHVTGTATETDTLRRRPESG